MKSHKRIWIAALCLMSAVIITVSLRARSTGVLAAQHSSQVSRAGVAQPAAYLANESLRAAAAISNTMMLDASGSQRPTMTVQRYPNINLPPVEEFTLTPPNPAQKIYKTTVAVRFPELAAEKLAAQIPITLGDQNVVLQRSPSDGRIFSAQVDFDWNAFAKEQQQRKELANAGRMIPVFEGRHFVRMDKVEFVDPVDIQNAQQSHQLVQFTPKILEGTGTSIDPQTELMITDLSVVQDPIRTWDPCASNGQGGRGVGTKMGVWTFGGLMAAIANDNPTTHHVADQMVTDWLTLFTHPSPPINSFVVQPRSGMTGVIQQWKQFASDGNNVDVSQAPLQLNAIVNRVDVGQGVTNAGELRFIFGYAPCPTGSGEGTSQLFNVIVEFNVPLLDCSGAETWAGKWQTIDTVFRQQCNNNFPCGPFNQALDNDVTSQVIAAPGAGQNLNQIRTNEVFLQFPTWELRAFQLTVNQGQQAPPLFQVPVFETPEGDPSGTDYNQSTCGPNTPNCGGATTTAFINGTVIDFPGTYIVPLTFGNTGNNHFQGANAFNAGLEFWNGSGTINSNVARSDFSANTCNGCHGKETQTDFQQVFNRQAGSGSPSVLAAFLVGCSSKSPLNAPCLPGNQQGFVNNTCTLQTSISSTACVNEFVSDPVIPSQTNSFGDLSRRAVYLSALLGANCQSGQLLRGLVDHKINFTH